MLTNRQSSTAHNAEKGGLFIMKKDDCIFCKLANGDIPTNALYEDDIVKVIFDLGPATRGHVLVVPKEHFDNIFSMDEKTAGHVFAVASKIAKFLNDELGCDGMNLLQNNGEIAGQTVNHFHLHLIPRYEGDGLNLNWPQQEISAEQLEEIRQSIKKSI